MTASWDLSGLRNTTIVAMPNRERAFGPTSLPFRAGDIDLASVPAVRAAALAALREPAAVVTDMTAERLLEGLAGPVLEWRVRAQFPATAPSRFAPMFPNFDDRATVRVGLDGAVRHVALPKNATPPQDWLAPAALDHVIAALREALGPKGLVAEVRLNEYGARIVAELPPGSGLRAALKFDREGLRRDGAPPARPGPLGPAFPLDALGETALAPRVADLDARLALPGEPLFHIHLYASEGYRAPKGSPMLEVWRNGRKQGAMTYRFATGEVTPVRW